MHITDLIRDGSGPIEFTEYRRSIDGKTRTIAEPSEALYELHHRLIRHLTDCNVPLPNATGSVAGGSPLKNVLQHRGNMFFYIIDLKNAFPSVASERLASVLAGIDPKLGRVEEITAFLDRYCMIEDGGLAQGGPASPLLFNLYCGKTIDFPLRALFARRAKEAKSVVTYTRYIDDLTFSAQSPFPRALRRRIREIIGTAGFAINHVKSRVVRLGTDKIEITGVHLLPSGLLCPTDEFLAMFERKLNAFLERGSEAASKESRASLQGLIGHFRELGNHSPLGNRTLRRVRHKAEVAHGVLSRGRRPRQSFGGQFEFPPDILEEVRRSTNLTAVVGKRVKLKMKGRIAWGLCPFHKEKTPSFKVDNARGRYKCFGCGEGGDVFSWFQGIEGLSFPDAARAAAKHADVQVKASLKSK